MLASRSSIINSAVLYFLALGFISTDVQYKPCNITMTSGSTTTRWKVRLGIGSPLKLFCFLDPDNALVKGYTASDVIFTSNGRPISSEYMTTVNSNTAKLHMNVSSIGEYVIQCKLPRRETVIANSATSEVICQSMVEIGSRPKEVNDFKCTSFNWLTLNCTWTTPDNDVVTVYKIQYQYPRRNRSSAWYNCPNDEEGKCTWTKNSFPPYKVFPENMTFLLEGFNEFGNTSQLFKFNHFAQIIPAAPAELKVLSKTSSSVYLQWNIGEFLNFKHGLVYKIECSWNSENSTANSTALKKHSAEEMKTPRSNVLVNVTNLKYPNKSYNISVQMKTAMASDDHWSPAASLMVTTNPDIPEESPKIDTGSFQVIEENANGRKIQIFWRQIPDDEYNGDDFRYEITTYEENKQMNKSITTASFIEFANLSLNKHRFFIRSVNAERSALHASIIDLPSQQDILPQPEIFTKFIYGNGKYAFCWKTPNIDKRQASNYTIFWCENNRQHPDRCDGPLNWTHVSITTNAFNFTGKLNISYLFGIAVNSFNSNSGIAKVACTVSPNTLNKINYTMVDEVGSTYIHLIWELECSECITPNKGDNRAVTIQGYNITYWSVALEPYGQCESPQKTYILYENTINHANITDLQPFKTYKMAVAMFTYRHTGPFGEYLIHQTTEAAPDMRNVTMNVTDITSTKAIIKWNPPTKLNGVLRHYEILYNDTKVIISNTNTTATLEHLLSYTPYSIRVSACTQYCSSTDPITIRTQIGAPSEVQNITLKVNASQALLSWSAPSIPAGPKPIYEVKVEQRFENHTLQVVQFLELDDLRTVMKIPCEQDQVLSTIEYTVRAKNRDSLNTSVFHHGMWSPAGDVQCWDILNRGSNLRRYCTDLINA